MSDSERIIQDPVAGQPQRSYLSGWAVQARSSAPPRPTRSIKPSLPPPLCFAKRSSGGPWPLRAFNGLHSPSPRVASQTVDPATGWLSNVDLRRATGDVGISPSQPEAAGARDTSLAERGDRATYLLWRLSPPQRMDRSFSQDSPGTSTHCWPPTLPSAQADACDGLPHDRTPTRA